MKCFGLMLFLIMKASFATEFFSDAQDINHMLSENELDQYLKTPTREGVDGPFLESLIPASTIKEPGQICPEDVAPKSSRYEVVLVASGTSEESSTEILPGQKVQIKTIELQNLVSKTPYSMESYGFKSENITARAKELWTASKSPGTFDPNSPVGRELFIESLLHAASRSTLPEKDLTKSMAKIIGETYKSQDEKFNALSAYSLRLYRNYNTSRNPQYDNPKNNPFGAPLPEGDLTANQLVNAASAFNVFQGGVCNDISESVAMVGEHLFPDRDVLTVNSGSHFGVVVTDGKTHRIIDGGTQIESQNRLLLVPEMTPTNLRISQVRDGALKQIAVVDTEMGQLTEEAFKTGKKLLKSDADISSLVLHLKKGDFGVSFGSGQLSDSKVLIVVAKYDSTGDKMRTYAGIGTTAQLYDNGNETKYQVHVKAGVEAKLFHYMNKSTDLKVTTGLHGSYTHTVNPYKWAPGAYKLDMSVGADWVNKIEVQHGKNKPDGVQLKGSIQTEHSFGPTNWGNTTGATSYIEPSDIKPLLKNVSFHLNQVNVDLEAEKKISNKVTGTVSGAYQGSNVGQRVNVLAGLKISAPEGAQILVFTGYSNSGLKGYKTNHSLLAGPKGIEGGVKLTTKKGIEIETKVQRSVSGKPAVRATISVPLSRSSGQ